LEPQSTITLTPTLSLEVEGVSMDFEKFNFLKILKEVHNVKIKHATQKPLDSRADIHLHILLLWNKLSLQDVWSHIK
jgi:hypothetical protein